MSRVEDTIPDAITSHEKQKKSAPLVYPIRRLLAKVTREISRDWRNGKYYPFASVLILITTVVISAYYMNHPQTEPYPDTKNYLTIAHLIQTQGHFSDADRMPGFPLLIVIVFIVAGQDNTAAVSIANAVLFAFATLGVYILVALVLRRAWAAFLVALLLGSNTALLSYVKPLLSEALAMWLVVSLALAIVLFMRSLRTRHLWAVTTLTLALILTRAEWIYLPALLFGYLLIVARWHGTARRLLPHMLASLVVLYAILGGYVLLNGIQNNYFGVTDAQNVNAYGKVIQYHMQNEGPSQFAAITRITNIYTTQGVKDPYLILKREPSLTKEHFTPIGDYARAIIEQHPGEFLMKSVPIALSSLTKVSNESKIAPDALFGGLLVELQSVFRALYEWNKIFLVCAAIWPFLLLWRRTVRLYYVQAMGAIILLALYGLAITSLGSYEDYMRFHISFDPLLIVIVWGNLHVGSSLIVKYGPGIIGRVAKSL